ncbi:MAG: amidohydrolase family protein [Acidobacteria bacterium]|nr:amidohydrolase family protein [Acidobacteriota bacterium]
MIDLHGQFLLRGLVDAHAHLGAERESIDRYLRFIFSGGITTVRDMAGDSFLYAQLRPRSNDAETPLARLYYSANWAGPSFWDDRRWVGSTQGKPPGEASWARAITATSDLMAEAAAHANGLRVWSHPVVFPSRPSDVVRSGIDVISHATLFVWEGATTLPTTYHSGAHGDFGPAAPYADGPVRSPAVLRVLEEMKRRGTMLDATVSTIPFSISETAAVWGYQLTALARSMGIPVVAGTDRDASQTADGYPTLFEELEALVDKCGFSALDAITTATLNGARALGIEKDFGTVEPGRMADLIVVRGDPAADIRNLRRVSYVIKSGRVHTSTARR